MRIACPTCRSPIDVPALTEVHVAEEVITGQIMAKEIDTGEEEDDTEQLTKPSKPKKKVKAKKTTTVKKTSKQARRLGLQVVGIGLVFLALAMCLYLAGLVCMSLGIVIPFWAVLGTLAWQVSVLLEIAAMVLFFWVPREAGARTALIGTVVVTLFTLAVQTGFWFVPTWFPEEKTRYWVIAGMFGFLVLLWMTHKVLLFMFTNCVSTYIGAEGTEHDSMRLIYQSIMLPFLTAGYPFLVVICSFTALGGIIIIVSGIALICYWVLYAIRYIALMMLLREFVTE
jgi:hypothetical protein